MILNGQAMVGRLIIGVLVTKVHGQQFKYNMFCTKTEQTYYVGDQITGAIADDSGCVHAAILGHCGGLNDIRSAHEANSWRICGVYTS